MKIKQCNRNPFWLSDFAYDGEFADGEKFCLRIPEEDVVEFATTLLQAYKDDKDGKVEVTMPHICVSGNKSVFIDGKVTRKEI